MSLFISQLVPSPSSPGVKVTNMTQKEPVSKGTSGNKTSQGGDVSQLGKSLEGQEEGEDVLVQETGSWRSKYFVILGFFLVFFFLFLIVIGFLVWKLRRTKVSIFPSFPSVIELFNHYIKLTEVTNDLYHSAGRGLRYLCLRSEVKSVCLEILKIIF